MCGIFLSCGDTLPLNPSDEVLRCLYHRGPDQSRIVSLRDGSQFLTFVSTVLSLRGDSLIEQPLQDESSRSILCWNGEAWKINDQPVKGNDAQAVFSLLLKVILLSKPVLPSEENQELVKSIFDNISGPYAFIFYDAIHHRIYYGRDLLGRRSLMRNKRPDSSFMISSVCSGTELESWIEVEAGAVYTIDLQAKADTTFKEEHLAWPMKRVLNAPARVSEHSSCDDPMPRLTVDSPVIKDLFRNLCDSISLRLTDIPLPPSPISKPTKVAILFSGGLDCTLLARIIHDLLPRDQEIDLLNVAFENPRVVRAARGNSSKSTSPYALCPDRITGLSSYSELKRICIGRVWRFVHIDIPYAETLAHRPQITSLIYPHNTEMDLSIACALYFAARGSGIVFDACSSTPTLYITPARVLFSGLGADELFAGYGRHAVAFRRRGQQGLREEMDLDIKRIGKRNLGRDDRVISHWGREARYPYLDEDFLDWALHLPLWEKCDFMQLPADSEHEQRNRGETVMEPGKLVLRLLILSLGMESVAAEKKRAIQFGARTAKMEAGKTKGTQTLS